ncbi:hypothetical protein LY78DRAFT_662186 [Colletotrichum sublineola]|uniref:Uncharacterized protein n=1 Tax=Colletotrichum sublineola TaxID=1173701 RepID=A0A066XC48_COLSU|nr:hypothetical protein LY78DRAFT_662186 [Colletotrichum sublineola]KDN63600.1 hypothetical protein CSUB01_06379 [Colletotrichum sublineola]
MRSTLFVRILTYSFFIAYAAADCCWLVWFAGYSNYLAQKWDSAAGVVRCGLAAPKGGFPAGTKCTVENSKDANGNIQAVTNVTFVENSQPFSFRIGIDPSSCKTLPDDKVVTGWEGWGAYLFKGSKVISDKTSACISDYSA